MNQKRFHYLYNPEESQLPTDNIDKNGLLDDDGCYNLDMSSDDFGITIYNETIGKTISVNIF